jgi:MFS family permease
VAETEAARVGTAASPFASPAYVRLLSSTVLSTAGDWLDFVAVLVLVAAVWHSGAAGLGVIAVAVGAPLVLAPVIGVWADRHTPRDVMVGADLARAVLTGAAALSPNLWVLAVLLFLRSGIGAAFSASEQRALVASVPQQALLRANALQQSAVQALKIAAPALGSLLTVAAGPRWSIGINAGTFVLSGLLLIGLPRFAESGQPEGGFMAQLKEGIAVVAGSGALLLLLVSLSATLFMTFSFDAMVPLAIARLGLPQQWIGFLVAAVGLGALLGALALSRLKSMTRPLFWVGLGEAGVALTLAVLALGLLQPARIGGVPWLVVVFLTGICTAGVIVPLPLIVQTAAPPQVLGRVWTVVAILPTALQVVAPALSALLLQWIGLGTLFLGAAAGLAAVAVITIVLQRRLPAPEPARDVPQPGAPDLPVRPVGNDQYRGKEVNPMSNLEQLRQIGVEVQSLSDEQRAVLTDLTDDEIALLGSISSRLERVSGDVEAHVDVIGGVLF